MLRSYEDGRNTVSFGEFSWSINLEWEFGESRASLCLLLVVFEDPRSPWVYPHFLPTLSLAPDRNEPFDLDAF